MEGTCCKRDGREGFAMGLALVLLGTFFLLDRLGTLDIGELWSWWALFPIGFGLVRLGSGRSAEAIASGVSWMLFGVWFLVSTHEWYGLDWSTSWPLAFVTIGASMVTRALLEPVFARRSPEDATAGGERRE